MMIRLVVGLIIAIVSFSYLFGVAIPHVQQAQEKVRIAQIEYDEAQAELRDEIRDEIQQTCMKDNPGALSCSANGIPRYPGGHSWPVEEET